MDNIGTWLAQSAKEAFLKVSQSCPTTWNSLAQEAEKAGVCLFYFCISHRRGGKGVGRVILSVCLNFSRCVFLYTVPPEGLPPLALFLFSHFCVSVFLHFPLQASYPLPRVSCPPSPLHRGLPRPPALFPGFLWTS